MNAFDPSDVVNKPNDKLPPEAMRLATEAHQRLTVVLRARKVAQRACVSLVLMGVFSGALAIVGGQGVSWSGLLMGVWMTVAGVVEYFGAQGVAGMKPKAFTMLAVNQVLLGGMFAVLGAWWMLALKMGWNTSDYSTAMRALNGLGASRQQLKPMIYTALYSAYGSLVVFGLLVDAPLSLYYIYRRRQLEAYLRETPAWIVQMHSVTAKAM